MGFGFGMNPLVGAGEQGKALFDVGVYPSVSAGPVRVLAEETDASGNEYFHPALLMCGLS
jgi:hypothetical protein